MAWQRKIPFGYQVQNGRINCHPEEAELVRLSSPAICWAAPTVRLLTRWPGKVCAIINILPSGTNTWSSGFWRMNGISGWMAIPSW